MKIFSSNSLNQILQASDNNSSRFQQFLPSILNILNLFGSKKLFRSQIPFLVHTFLTSFTPILANSSHFGVFPNEKAQTNNSKANASQSTASDDKILENEILSGIENCINTIYFLCLNLINQDSQLLYAKTSLSDKGNVIETKDGFEIEDKDTLFYALSNFLDWTLCKADNLKEYKRSMFGVTTNSVPTTEINGAAVGNLPFLFFSNSSSQKTEITSNASSSQANRNILGPYLLSSLAAKPENFMFTVLHSNSTNNGQIKKFTPKQMMHFASFSVLKPFLTSFADLIERTNQKQKDSKVGLREHQNFQVVMNSLNYCFLLLLQSEILYDLDAFIAKNVEKKIMIMVNSKGRTSNSSLLNGGFLLLKTVFNSSSANAEGMVLTTQLAYAKKKRFFLFEKCLEHFKSMKYSVLYSESVLIEALEILSVLINLIPNSVLTFFFSFFNFSQNRSSQKQKQGECNWKSCETYV